MPTCVTAPLLTWLMIIAPVPAKTRPNVPSISAPHLFTRADDCVLFPHSQRKRGRGEALECWNIGIMECWILDVGSWILDVGCWILEERSILPGFRWLRLGVETV